MRFRLFFLFTILIFACKEEKATEPEVETGRLQLVSIKVGTAELSLSEPNIDLPTDAPIVIRFSSAIDKNTAIPSISLVDHATNEIPLEFAFLDNDKTISLKPNQPLTQQTTYQLSINEQLKGALGETFPGLQATFTTLNPPLNILKIEIEGREVTRNERIADVGFSPNIKLTFSEPVKQEEVTQFSKLVLGSLNFNFDTQQINDSTLTFTVTDELLYYRKYRFSIAAGLGELLNKEFSNWQLEFFTKLDTTPKFPNISDDALLTKVQEQTFKYFWDFGHPVSGLSRERVTSLETVTSGGSGFGLMTIIVGIERGFITRAEGVVRLKKIVAFLEKADRFHGVWSHWLNGSTGKVIPFSAKDDGGDLVETSYLAMGLLTVRQYLNSTEPEEKLLIDQITQLWETIEWNWHTQGGQNVLYWHWSPRVGWEKNLKIGGYNEALITYILAAASPTFPIDAPVYHEGWARNGAMKNGQSFYDINLPLGHQAYGGPLFFEHYTFLGIDPRQLKDTYADYWQQTVNHTLINRAYCIENPKNFIGYNNSCWGLTASDNHAGYSAHSPTNDLGVITPTAALSSFPYTPEYSMEALNHFYYTLGDRIWKEYGFVDAFNFSEQWVAQSFLAIDQGPIIIMIENHRTGLLWDLLMSSPEVQNGLTKLGFTY